MNLKSFTRVLVRPNSQSCPDPERPQPHITSRYTAGEVDGVHEDPGVGDDLAAHAS